VKTRVSEEERKEDIVIIIIVLEMVGEGIGGDRYDGFSF